MEHNYSKIFKLNDNDFSCPICYMEYNEKSIRNLQKHCNRVHNKSLINLTEHKWIEKLMSKGKQRKLNNKTKMKKAYREKVVVKNNTAKNSNRIRCKYISRTGKQCLNFTIGKFHCHRHIPHGIHYAEQNGVYTEIESSTILEVKRSTLPDKFHKNGTVKVSSGNGVFALQNIQQGDVITEYSGNPVSYEQFQLNEYNRFYFLKCPSSFPFYGIDGFQTTVNQAGVGSLINSGYESNSSKYKPFQNNVRFHFDTSSNKAWIVAKKYIKKEKELFINYGDSYRL